MAFRHVRDTYRPRSSGSISTNSSESPHSGPAFDFTLYGSPAPRSAHRTSSGAGKSKPRRRSNKPVPAPPTSPQSTSYYAEELQLDLSSLAADEDESIIISNGGEIYYKEYDTVCNESNNESRHVTKGKHVAGNHSGKSNGNGRNRNSCSEAMETGDVDNIESSGKAMRLFAYEKESRDKQSEDLSLSKNTDDNTLTCCYSDGGQISSDSISSNQSFGEERSGSTRSCLSNSSSYVTLSEYSIDSCSNASSLKLRKSHESGGFTLNGINSFRETSGDVSANISHKEKKVERRSVELAVESPRKEEGTQQITSTLRKENPRGYPENGIQKEVSTLKSSGCIVNNSMVTELQTALSCGGEDSACASDSFSVSVEGRDEQSHNFLMSSTCRNECEISTTSIETITDKFIEVNESKRELDNISDNASDNDENDNTDSKSSKIYGRCFLNKGHEIQMEEWMIKEERRAEQLWCVCCAAGNTKICSCLSKSFLLHGSKDQSTYNSDFHSTGDRRSRSKSNVDEKPNEDVAGVDVKSRNTFSGIVGVESASSDSNTSPSSLTNLEHNEGYDDTFDNFNANCQFLPGSNEMLPDDFYFSPIRPHSQNTVGSLSAMTCDSECGRKSRNFLEHLESGYLPDISLSAGEVMEAVICARQLVCVLEHAMERTLASDANHGNIDSSVAESSVNFPTKPTRRKVRSNSLSPSILRRCKGKDYKCYSTTTEFRPDRKRTVLDAESAAGKNEGVNARDICDVKPIFSCDGFGTRRCSYKDAPPLLIVSAEELRKQRSLLKPANERRVRVAAVQVVDAADILRKTITRRRKFLDPSDEFIRGNNRSYSEWSLENV